MDKKQQEEERKRSQSDSDKILKKEYQDLNIRTKSDSETKNIQDPFEGKQPFWFMEVDDSEGEVEAIGDSEGEQEG